MDKLLFSQVRELINTHLPSLFRISIMFLHNLNEILENLSSVKELSIIGNSFTELLKILSVLMMRVISRCHLYLRNEDSCHQKESSCD